MAAWALGATRRDRMLIGAWAASAAVNVVAMYLTPGEETIPFHLIWIGLAIVYGYTDWSLAGMICALTLVAVGTGYILAHNAATGRIGWAETAEVPLMSALFVVMAWHVRRRHHALAETARLAEVDRRRAEAQQMFIRFASHELRTPITVARGYAEMIRAGHQGAATDPLGAATIEDATIVLDELDKLSRITQRLLTLMQVDDAGTRWPTDVDSELARIVRRWEPTADRLWSVRCDVGVVPAKPDRLEAAVDCLIENAVKFTAAGDRIEVTGARGAEHWRIEVADTGHGVTPDEAATLTAGAAPRRTRTGSGLGLAIVRTVVEAWGGQVSVAARPGGGTVVTLSVPCPAEARGREPGGAVPAPAVVPAGSAG